MLNISSVTPLVIRNFGSSAYSVSQYTTPCLTIKSTTTRTLIYKVHLYRMHHTLKRGIHNRFSKSTHYELCCAWTAKIINHCPIFAFRFLLFWNQFSFKHISSFCTQLCNHHDVFYGLYICSRGWTFQMNIDWSKVSFRQNKPSHSGY